jgi:hypothetical protein
MTHFVLNVVPYTIPRAHPREITLPKFWRTLDLLDRCGEERTSYHRIAENGVFTKILRSQFNYDGNFSWQMETSFSSNFTTEFFDESDLGMHFAAKPLTKEEFEVAERLVLAIIARIEPPERHAAADETDED